MQKISEEIQELKARGEKYDLNYADQELLARPMTSDARRKIITVSAMPVISDDDLKKIDEICVRSTTERVSNLFNREWEEWILDAIKILDREEINTPEHAKFWHIIRKNKVFDETVTMSDDVKLYEIPYVLNPSNEYCRDKLNGRFNSTQMGLMLKNDGEYRVTSYKEEGSIVIAVHGESIIGVKCDCSMYYSLLNQPTHDGLTNLKTVFTNMSWFGNENVCKVMNEIMNETVPAADQSGCADGFKTYNSSRVSHLSFILETAKNYEWLFYRIAYALERHSLSRSIDASPVRIRQRIMFMQCLKELHDNNCQYLADEDNAVMSSIVKNW